MGAAEARRLAQGGCRIAVVFLSGKGEALAQELGGVGMTGSNQSNDDVQRLVDLAMGRWRRIDALVNSAGHAPCAPIDDITEEDWHKGMEIYFLTAVRPTRLVAPIMAAQGGAPSSMSPQPVAFEPSAMFPTLGSVSCGIGKFHEDLCGYLCGEERPHEQRPAGLDQQPACH